MRSRSRRSRLLRCRRPLLFSFGGPLKVGTLKVGTLKVGTSKVGTSKVGTSKVGTLKVGMLKVGTLTVGSRGYRVGRFCFCRCRVACVGACRGMDAIPLCFLLPFVCCGEHHAIALGWRRVRLSARLRCLEAYVFCPLGSVVGGLGFILNPPGDGETQKNVCSPNAKNLLVTYQNLFGDTFTACDFVDLAPWSFCIRLVVPLQGSFGHSMALRPLCLGDVPARKTGSERKTLNVRMLWGRKSNHAVQDFVC